jgi:hypothetical protein
MTYSLAVDIGGTFTDIVLRNSDGRLSVDKTLTTHEDLLSGFFGGVNAVLKKAGISSDAIDGVIVHATTVVTNALIERKGPPTALVVTEGIRRSSFLSRWSHRNSPSASRSARLPMDQLSKHPPMQKLKRLLPKFARAVRNRLPSVSSTLSSMQPMKRMWLHVCRGRSMMCSSAPRPMSLRRSVNIPVHQRPPSTLTPCRSRSLICVG